MLTDQQLTHQKRLNEHSSLKALQMITALAITGEYMSISELSEVTGLSTSTVHRILQELMECGYVTKDPQYKKYRTGFEAMVLASHLSSANYLLEASREEMERLNNLSLETVNLTVLDGFQGTFVGKVESKNQIRMRSKVGWKVPLYCTSGGKIMLAHQPEDWLSDYFRETPLERFTDYTITDEDTLRTELKKIRENGFALDRWEHNPDVVCLSAPIFSANGLVIGAIGIAAPDYRFSVEKALTFRDDVIAAAKEITARLAR